MLFVEAACIHEIASSKQEQVLLQASVWKLLWSHKSSLLDAEDPFHFLTLCV